MHDVSKFGFYSSGRKQSFDLEKVPKLKDKISLDEDPDWLHDMSRSIQKRDSEESINAHIDAYRTSGASYVSAHNSIR